jgi:hypothetical protein
MFKGIHLPIYLWATNSVPDIVLGAIDTKGSKTNSPLFGVSILVEERDYPNNHMKCYF